MRPVQSEGFEVSEVEPYLSQLRAAYPDLHIANAEPLKGGQYNVVLRVNDDLIFRFPRFPEGAEKLRREAAILDGIRPHVDLAIPNFTYRRLDLPGSDEIFVGYRMVPGEPFWHEVAATLDADARARVASQLAHFLRELHAIPYREVIGAALPIASGMTASDWQTGWRDLYARIEMSVFPRVAAEVRAGIAAQFLPLLNSAVAPALTPALIHGDFGTGNLLFERSVGKIVGIIDFGSAGLGDPAYDLAALLTYGEPFAEAALDAYPALRPALPRARAYRATFAAQEALYGAEHDDPGTFARGIAPYAAGTAGAQGG